MSQEFQIEQNPAVGGNAAGAASRRPQLLVGNEVADVGLRLGLGVRVRVRRESESAGDSESESAGRRATNLCAPLFYKNDLVGYRIVDLRL